MPLNYDQRVMARVSVRLYHKRKRKRMIIPWRKSDRKVLHRFINVCFPHRYIPSWNVKLSYLSVRKRTWGTSGTRVCKRCPVVQVNVLMCCGFGQHGLRTFLCQVQWSSKKTLMHASHLGIPATESKVSSGVLDRFRQRHNIKLCFCLWGKWKCVTGKCWWLDNKIARYSVWIWA